MNADNPARGELISWLERDEAASRPHRADRLRLLLQEYGAGRTGFFYGGEISWWAFEDATQAYLHGLFLACTIMCQVCLEHLLAGVFREAGRDDLDRATFETLLRAARNECLISEDEFTVFDRLRMLRNPYTHPRAPTGKGSLTVRAVETDTPPQDLVVQDAEFAITALLRLCRRPPFALIGDNA